MRGLPRTFSISTTLRRIPILADAHEGVLGERPFVLLLCGRTASAVGDRMVPVALTFAVIDMSSSGTALGLVLAAGLLPNALFVILGGVYGDRFDRGRIMVASDLIRAVSQGTIAALLITGDAAVWELAVSNAVWGTAAAFFTPASTGLIPLTVPGSKLQQANATLSLSRSVVGLGGPALAGLLVGVLGPGIVFAVDAASFVASALFVASLRLPRAAVPHGRLVADLRQGWRELVSRRWVWVSILGFGSWNVAQAFFFVVGPLVIVAKVGGALDWGVVMTGAAIGAAVGGVVALRLNPRRPVLVLWLLLIVPAIQFVLLLPPAPLPLLAVGAAIGSIFVVSAVTIWSTCLQRFVPAEALSRVSAYDWLGSLITMPIGYAIAGTVFQSLGATPTLWLCTAVMGGTSLAVIVGASAWRVEYEPERPTLESAVVDAGA